MKAKSISIFFIFWITGVEHLVGEWPNKEWEECRVVFNFAIPQSFQIVGDLPLMPEGRRAFFFFLNGTIPSEIPKP